MFKQSERTGTETRRSLAMAASRGILVAAALSALAAPAPALAYTYTVEHNFTGTGTPEDGANSTSSLVKVGNKYYGTTQSGGAYGYGTVFRMNANGTLEKDIYDFGTNGPLDGHYPHSGLIYDPVTNLLYGTTVQGGSGSASNCPDFGSCGTVFSVVPCTLPACSENVVYDFGTLPGAADGYAPYAGLTYDSATQRLYGATADGGLPGTNCSTSYSQCGTVYYVTTAGSETVVHPFAGMGAGDGANPFAAPILDSSGDLFGTTAYGGVACADLPNGCGTMWELPFGATTDALWWAFGGAANNDGAGPHGKLVYWFGAYWSTTTWGGANSQGMVFRVPAPGSELNIHNFTGGADGGWPEPGLTNGGKYLFGVTTLGANTSCSYYYAGGCGTIFDINPSHVLTTIYTFNNANSPPDGGSSFDAPFLSGRYLWDTTVGGGTNGYGTIFKFGPVP